MGKTNSGRRLATIEIKGERTANALAKAAIEALRRDGFRGATLHSAEQAADGVVILRWHTNPDAKGYPGVDYIVPRKGDPDYFHIRTAATIFHGTEVSSFAVARHASASRQSKAR